MTALTILLQHLFVLRAVDLKIRTFLHAIKENGTAPVPSSQLPYNQAIIDGIARSAEAGREIEVVISEIYSSLINKRHC